MSDLAFDPALQGHAPVARPKLDQGMTFGTVLLFVGIMTAGVLYVAYSLYADIAQAGTAVNSESSSDATSFAIWL